MVVKQGNSGRIPRNMHRDPILSEGLRDLLKAPWWGESDRKSPE